MLAKLVVLGLRSGVFSRVWGTVLGEAQEQRVEFDYGCAEFVSNMSSLSNIESEKGSLRNGHSC